MPRVFASVLALVVLALPAAALGAVKDPAVTALNIIPSGQFGSIPIPPGADRQALMYDALTPLFDKVTDADLRSDFKSEAFNRLGTDGPGKPESVPRKGVKIVRDKFNVPHVTATTHDGGVWAAGWIAAEDRALLLEQARYNSRVAAIDAPGLPALPLISSLRSFVPSAQTEAAVARQTSVLRAAGKEGRAVLHDIDTFVKGINAKYKAAESSAKPWTRNDVYRAQRAQGPVRRPGRRRRGAPDAVPLRAAGAAGRRARAGRVQRPAPARRPRAAGHRSRAVSHTRRFPPAARAT